jgi:AbrB family looped-hinge helix DNA binding protein
MRTTIDKAGRVVIPKSVRDRLGLRPGTPLDVVVTDDAVHLRPAVPLAVVAERDGRLVAVSDTPIDDAIVQDLRDAVSR